MPLWLTFLPRMCENGSSDPWSPQESLEAIEISLWFQCTDKGSPELAGCTVSISVSSLRAQLEDPASLGKVESNQGRQGT